MRSQIDELVRKRESVQRATPALTLVAGVLMAAAAAIAGLTPSPNAGAIFACSFAACAAAYIEKKTAKLNLEIIDRLNAMEARLQELEAGQASHPPASSGK